MADFILIAIFGSVIATVVYLLKGKQKDSNQPDNRQRNYDERPFHRHSKQYALRNKHSAVTISHDSHACDAVKKLGNVRFLVRDAPLLPVKGCTRSHDCECQYLHHTDRRKADRRSSIFGDNYLDENKRHKPRRDEDQLRIRQLEI
ncbi:MAG: hypothetical protein HKN88_06000 [Gammaproteobacteria bacterium]|nr:hypothetical protein [Gammaproteobacteria bacterium]NNC97609.1 hypothetical protein [Gammaproteobacteria bacterium]NNM14205.1 hypothetical protein [Gammaproteobacteria bacterium]